MSFDYIAASMLPQKSIARLGERQLDVTATKAMESVADKTMDAAGKSADSLSLSGAAQEAHGFKYRMQVTAGKAVIAATKVSWVDRLFNGAYGMLTKPKIDTPELSNVGHLSDRLTRGAQPTNLGFETLKQQGYKTVINLRPEANWEKPMVESRDMNYLYMPLPPVGEPTNQQAVSFLSTVLNPENGKVFFHCQHGADRTGAMAAAYRIAVQGWSADKALAEMPTYHFHDGFEFAKADFVHNFANYWHGLDPKAQAKVLYGPLNAQA